MEKTERMRIIRLIAGEVKEQIRVSETPRGRTVVPERSRRKGRKITLILTKRWASQARSC